MADLKALWEKEQATGDTIQIMDVLAEIADLESSEMSAGSM